MFRDTSNSLESKTLYHLVVLNLYIGFTQMLIKRGKILLIVRALSAKSKVQTFFDKMKIMRHTQKGRSLWQ